MRITEPKVYLTIYVKGAEDEYPFVYYNQAAVPVPLPGELVFINLSSVARSNGETPEKDWDPAWFKVIERRFGYTDGPDATRQYKETWVEVELYCEPVSNPEEGE